MRIALDSNILAYLAGARVVDADDRKIDLVRTMVRKLRATVELVAPVQALGELFIVLRRSGVPPEQARERVGMLASGHLAATTSSATLDSALDLAVDHRLQFWDSMILAAAGEAGCSLLLSEDMQNGFMARGVTIANPLTERPHEKLARLLA